MANINKKSCNCKTNKKNTVHVFPKVSVLPNDYVNLVNLPSVNGVTLLGELTSSQLNLLSSKVEDYPDVAIDDALGGGKFVVLLGEDGEATKIPVKDFMQGTSGISTLDDVSPETAINAYVFKKK